LAAGAAGAFAAAGAAGVAAWAAGVAAGAAAAGAAGLAAGIRIDGPPAGLGGRLIRTVCFFAAASAGFGGSGAAAAAGAGAEGGVGGTGGVGSDIETSEKLRFAHPGVKPFVLVNNTFVILLPAKALIRMFFGRIRDGFELSVVRFALSLSACPVAIVIVHRVQRSGFGLGFR
jgi:hypothetical protein